MKYPEKYPNGFMYAAQKADEQGNIVKRNRILCDGLQYFSDIMYDELSGIRVADNDIALAVLYSLCRTLEAVTQDNGELARELDDNFKTRTTITKVPIYGASERM